jgi:BirA family biotin operon repressor/biotin-[acetyl-CoA-carboxylase] ligase
MMTALRFEQVDIVDSTNAELMRRETVAGEDTPVALWALRQTAGRGRRGRMWHSDPEDSITLSVAVGTRRPVSALLGLPLAVGVCVAQTLESLGAQPVFLKWPNDLYTWHPGGWCKSGGILTEVRTLPDPSGPRGPTAPGHRVVCGFGLNLFAPPASLVSRSARSADAAPEPLEDEIALAPAPAGALFEHTLRQTLDRTGLARALALKVADCMRAYPDSGFEVWRAGWQQRDLLAGRRIQVHHAETPVLEARALGVTAHGALDIEDQSGRRTSLASGEVSVRLGPQDLTPHPSDLSYTRRHP